jgi:hypothetical protein
MKLCEPSLHSDTEQAEESPDLALHDRWLGCLEEGEGGSC